VLERIGLMNYFDVIADAAKVKRSKPDPEIFLTCAEQLSIDPRDCVGIEDSQAGIEAIHSAGMFSVGINVTVISQEPDLVLKSTSELDLNNIKTNFENRA
jgi:beta-phosphoglucomutase